MFKQVFNVPNMLSIVRIILIPVFIIVYFNDDIGGTSLAAGGILLLSAATDVLDGIIARKFDMTTELGKYLDPLADKLTQFTVAVCIGIRHRSNILLLCLIAVVFLKELAMGLGAVRLVRKGVEVANAKWFGKISTAIFYLAMMAIVSIAMSDMWINILVGLVAAVMLFALYKYVMLYFEMVRAKNAAEANLPEDV